MLAMAAAETLGEGVGAKRSGEEAMEFKEEAFTRMGTGAARLSAASLALLLELLALSLLPMAGGESLEKGEALLARGRGDVLRVETLLKGCCVGAREGGVGRAKNAAAGTRGVEPRPLNTGEEL